MKLDDKIVSFLQSTMPLFIHLAVVSVAHRPYSVRGFGVKVHREADQLGVYILKSQSAKVLQYLTEGNGRVACLFTDGLSNESYQIKGRLVEATACVDDMDRDILNRYRKSSLSLSPLLYSKFPLSPSTCDLITYTVSEIFIQTPGPNAGSKYRDQGVER